MPSPLYGLQASPPVKSDLPS